MITAAVGTELAPGWPALAVLGLVALAMITAALIAGRWFR